jgi:hypothetical protein
MKMLSNADQPGHGNEWMTQKGLYLILVHAIAEFNPTYTSMRTCDMCIHDNGCFRTGWSGEYLDPSVSNRRIEKIT